MRGYITIGAAALPPVGLLDLRDRRGRWLYTKITPTLAFYLGRAGYGNSYQDCYA